MKLPLLISVPHGGMNVPPEVSDICTLSKEDIAADSDEGAAAIYSNLKQHCEAYLTSDIARAVIDLNRPPDDIGGDGVIKSHTCWNVPIYRNFPDDALIQVLLARYYFPYHKKLSAGAGNNAIKLGIDCHTMSASGPPVGPDPGQSRPLACISNADGTCPQEWITALAGCFTSVFKDRVTINTPFRGGYITRSHAAEMPWLQIEISRTGTYPNEFKRDCVHEGLHRFCHTVFKEFLPWNAS
jgi:formiminoglutamase